jgi:signal transduction histidine kinase
MRVLVIEDNPIDAAVILERLRAPGSPVVETEHVGSLEALSRRRLTQPDVVLLDLSLPEARGAETIRRARAALGDAAIVVLTSDDDPALSVLALREGAEDYLVKGSFGSDTLVRALRYAHERSELRRRLAHADRLAAVGRLAAGVAHEVANPAALALAAVERLEHALPAPTTHGADDDPRALVAHTRGALERIRDVVRELQGYARLDRGRPGPVDLNDSVRRVMSLLSSSLRHSVRLEQRAGIITPIDADGGQVEQVLTNLIMNAAHAIETRGNADGRVVVSTEQRGSRVLLVVEDNGIGMSAEVQTRIFEPFYTTRTPGGGTGLGLAIVLELVRQNRAQIRCESAPGRGARFELEWPASAGRVAAAGDAKGDRAAEGAPARAIAPAARARVLFVDDEPAIAEVYGALLGEQHDVTVALGGARALEELRGDKPFDVVVCDLMMPGVDGAAVYDHVLRERPDLAARFVMCSGGLVTERARAFAARGAVKLLYKPVPTQHLLSTIEELAARARA